MTTSFTQNIRFIETLQNPPAERQQRERCWEVRRLLGPNCLFFIKKLPDSKEGSENLRVNVCILIISATSNHLSAEQYLWACGRTERLIGELLPLYEMAFFMALFCSPITHKGPHEKFLGLVQESRWDTVLLKNVLGSGLKTHKQNNWSLWDDLIYLIFHEVHFALVGASWRHAPPKEMDGTMLAQIHPQTSTIPTQTPATLFLPNTHTHTRCRAASTSAWPVYN